MATITPEELKRASGLPDNANFHGWLIHNPDGQFKNEGL